uniref:Rab3 GTPase-activating protein catalytic subunit n=1 Tax=Amphimedon queenslandica TaxID=400682 RepID=A0A1X7TIV9_AMPQE
MDSSNDFPPRAHHHISRWMVTFGFSTRYWHSAHKCLFPDSVPGSSVSGHEQLTEDSLTCELKSAPPNSLTMRLAKAFCNIHNDYGLKAMAHIWYEVIQELRYRWENGIALPSPRFGSEILDGYSALAAAQEIRTTNLQDRNML